MSFHSLFAAKKTEKRYQHNGAQLIEVYPHKCPDRSGGGASIAEQCHQLTPVWKQLLLLHTLGKSMLQTGQCIIERSRE